MTAISKASAVGPLEAVRILRSAAGALLSQASVHGQLLRLEWAEEKNRLLRMLVAVLLGFACLLCTLLFLGALVLAGFWETPYRMLAVISLVAVYGTATALAWRRFQSQSALSDQSFAASREELAADLALLRSQL